VNGLAIGMPRRRFTKEMYDNNGKRDNSAVFIGKVIVVVTVKYIAIVHIMLQIGNLITILE